MNLVIAGVPVYFHVFGVFASSVLLTLCAIKAAIYFGFVYRPVAYRWNTRTVALGGGTAILLALFAGMLLTQSSLCVSLLPALMVVFALGLYDDIKGVGPWVKLSVELIAASWVFWHGFTFGFGPLVVMVPLSAFWFLGIINAQNIIDNMDGIAAGSAGISALGFAAMFAFSGGSSDLQLFSLLTAAACFGFLFFNFNPAKIFMGDAGSLPLGFILGVLATAFTHAPHGKIWWKIFAIANVLLVPLFDTFLVSVSRKTTGRLIMSGGKDHTTHRLVRAGLSERQTALLIYSLGVLGVTFALCTYYASLTWLIFIALLWAVSLLWFARFLWAVPTYEAGTFQGRTLLNNLPRWVDSFAEKSIQSLSVIGIAIITSELLLGAPGKDNIGIPPALSHLLRYSCLLLAAHLLLTSVPKLRNRLKNFRVKFQISDVLSKSLEVGN